MTKTDNGWIAMIQHYFISAWTDVRGETGKHEREFYTSKLDQNLFAVGSILKLGTVEPKQSVNTPLRSMSVHRIRIVCPIWPTVWIWWSTMDG